MSIEFDTARQVVAASVLEECGRPDDTALDPNDRDDVYRALDAVSTDAVSEETKVLDGIYTLSIAAVAESRAVRLTARQDISNLCSAHGEYFVYMDDADNQRLAADATACDLQARAGAISAVRWLSPYAATHALPPDVLDTIVPAVFDALSDGQPMLRRGAALSIVACVDSDDIRSTYPGDVGDFAESVVAATEDADPFVRGHALSVLNCPKPDDDLDGFKTAMNAYLTALSDGTDCDRRTALDALSTTSLVRRRATPPEALEMLPQVAGGLRDCFRSSSPVVRRRASELLWDLDHSLPEEPNDDDALAAEIGSIGEVVAELPPDRETDKYLLYALSALIEAYPQLVGPALSVVDRVLTNTPSVHPPEEYVRIRPDYMREKAVEVLQDVFEVAPAAGLPANDLYSLLADPSESVRRKTAVLFTSVATQAPDSLGSYRDLGLMLRDHWERDSDEADDTSSTDPLTAIAKHSSEEAAELSRRLVEQTPDDELDDAIALLRTLAEFAPEAVEPVLEETTRANGSC